MKNKLVKSFLEFSVGNIATLLLGLISSPIITRLILPDEFGKFSMFTTVTSLIQIVLLLGFDQSYVRFYYEEDEENRSVLLMRCIKIPMLINIGISLLLFLLYKPISNFILGEYSIFIIIMIIFNNTFYIFNKFSLLLIRMKQKGKQYSALQIASKLIYILVIVCVFKLFKSDYRTLVVAIVISNLIVAIIAIFIEKKTWFKKLRGTKVKVSNKQIFDFGFPLIFSTAVIWIFQSIDKVFIKEFSGYLELGLYSSAFYIISLLNTLQGAFTTFWIPVANKKYKEGNSEEFFIKINNLVSMVLIILGALVITFKDLIIMFLGSNYNGAAYIFPFLVFMPIMYTISETTVIGINFKVKSKYHLIIAIISSVVNIIGNYLFIPSMGAKGAAISTGISYIVFFVLRTHFAQKLYYIRYNLKKIYISLIPLFVLALYSSFNKIDIKIIILGLACTILDLLLYKNTVIEVINEIFKEKRKK